jgi:hypothetical protein
MGLHLPDPEQMRQKPEKKIKKTLDVLRIKKLLLLLIL